VANDNHTFQLRQGVASWNAWRVGVEVPDLVEASLIGADLGGANLIKANLSGANLFGANLVKANLSGANLHEADLIEANLINVNLRKANLSGANLHGAYLREAILSEANLSGADLGGTNFRGANLRKANLSGANLHAATLVETDLTGADLTGCRIYGVSAWRVKLDGTKQQNLIVTPSDEPEITVDSIEVAQFVYLLLHNRKIRDVIETITSKAVLILGRFTEERKKVLDALREELRNYDLVPIVFDFPISRSLDVTETIKVLAGLARFVIADITDATEVRVELNKIVPEFTLLPVQPILVRGHAEFVSMQHLARFPWVLPVFEYDDPKHLLASLNKSVVSPAMAKARELRGRVS
jgi:hypothetical protein